MCQEGGRGTTSLRVNGIGARAPRTTRWKNPWVHPRNAMETAPTQYVEGRIGGFDRRTDEGIGRLRPASPHLGRVPIAAACPGLFGDDVLAYDSRGVTDIRREDIIACVDSG